MTAVGQTADSPVARRRPRRAAAVHEALVGADANEGFAKTETAPRRHVTDNRYA